MCIEGSPTEILIQIHWNLMGLSMTTPNACDIAQQYSSATFVSLRFHTRKEKKWRSLKKLLLQNLYFFSCVCDFFPPVALRPNAGHGLLILEVSRSHTMTHHSR